MWLATISSEATTCATSCKLATPVYTLCTTHWKLEAVEIDGTRPETQCNTSDKYRRADRDKAVCCSTVFVVYLSAVVYLETVFLCTVVYLETVFVLYCSVFGSDGAETWGMVTQTFHHSLVLVPSKRMSNARVALFDAKQRKYRK